MTSALDEAPAPTSSPEGAADAASARATTSPREVWSRSRLPVTLLLLLVAVSVVIALASGGARVGYLDPDAADPTGARAITRLLEDRGIEVTRRAAPAVRTDTTVVIASPDLVDPSLLAAVIDGLGPDSDVVLLGAGQDTVRELDGTADLDASVAGTTDEDERRLAGGAEVATVAGVARTGGYLYDAPRASFRCYAAEGSASLVVFERTDGPRVSLAGTGDFLTNRRLDENGNAALALGLLTRRGQVDWVYPRLDEVGLEAQERGLGDLLPERLQWALFQLALAVVLLALWRARRLGPVVAEQLPVVVRAAEAVEGRARLYEGGGARDGAAAVLRGAARDRLVRVLGLGRDTSREAVCLAVSDRSSLSSNAVELLLYGGPPGDDAELVRLAAALDSLEREVRTT